MSAYKTKLKEAIAYQFTDDFFKKAIDRFENTEETGLHFEDQNHPEWIDDLIRFNLLILSQGEVGSYYIMYSYINRYGNTVTKYIKRNGWLVRLKEDKRNCHVFSDEEFKDKFEVKND